MSFFHGVRASEIATAITPPIEQGASLTVAFGTAPQHLAKRPAGANKPVLCYSYAEFVEQFGWSEDFDKYTLCEVAYSQFVLYGYAPVVFVNVLDKKHTKTSELKLEGVNSVGAVINKPVLLDTFSAEVRSSAIETLAEVTDYDLVEDVDDEIYTISLKKTFSAPIEVTYILDGENVSESKTSAEFPIEISNEATGIKLSAEVERATKLTLGEDYKIEYNDEGELEFEVLAEEKVPDDVVFASFKEYDSSLVEGADIIGGVDLVTDKLAGLELVEEIFPKFRLVPSIIIAPKYSQEVGVAAAMKAKCTGINGVFRAVAIADLPTSTIKSYTNAAEYKNLKNLVDASLIVCYPKLSLDGKQFYMSTQLASLMYKVDYEEGDDMPYYSPSNHQLQCDSTVLEDGTEKLLSLEQANYLNSQGISTAINFSNGWCFWGNRTSLYPSSSDVKDIFIAVRRFFGWFENNLILSYFQKVDQPTNRRLIDNLVNSINIYLNGLAAKGAVLPGSHIEFKEADNPTTDLLSGKITFHIYITPPIPAEEIHFKVEYDVSNLSNLFS